MDNILNCPLSDFGNIDLYSDELNEIFTTGFNFKILDGVVLYGLIEGYGDINSSKYFEEKLLLKICSNLNLNMTDIEIKNLLYQTFIAIENNLIYDLETEAHIEFKNSGLAVITLLLVNNKLFIANTGPNIGLMCRIDDEDIYHVDKLNADHSLNAVEELGRLSSLGIDLSLFKLLAKEICPLNSLRIIGDTSLKTDYKNHNILSKLTSSPWSASPQVIGPTTVDESSQILLLISSGLFELLSRKSDVTDVNKYLCSLILKLLGQHEHINELFAPLKQEIIAKFKDVKFNFGRSTGLLFCCLNENLIGNKVRERETLANAPPPSTNRPKALSIEIPSSHDLSQNLTNWQPFCDNLNLGTDTSILTKTGTEISTSTGTDESTTFHHQAHPQLDDKGQIAAYIDFTDYYQFIDEKFKSRDRSVDEYFLPFI